MIIFFYVVGKRIYQQKCNKPQIETKDVQSSIIDIPCNGLADKIEETR